MSGEQPNNEVSSEDQVPGMSGADSGEISGQSSPAEPLLGDKSDDPPPGPAKESADSEDLLHLLPSKKGCCNISESQAWMFGSFAALFSLLVFGTLYFHAAEEDWTLQDAWYFSVVSLTTVGYGVLTPTPGINRVVTTVFIICSVTAGSIAVGTITATLITSLLEKADDVILKVDPEKEPMRPGVAFALAWKKLRVYRLITLAFCIIVALLGSGFMSLMEGWSFADSFYFSIVTMSTVGYGDMGPIPEHRFAASIYILLSTAVFAFSVSSLLASFVSRAKRDSARDFMRGALTVQKLKVMDIDGDGEVSKDEFRVFMLTRLGFIEQEVLDEIDAAFDAIDADGSGTLDKDDLVGVHVSDTLRDASMKKGV